MCRCECACRGHARRRRGRIVLCVRQICGAVRLFRNNRLEGSRHMTTVQVSPECEARVQVSSSAGLNEIVDYVGCRSELEIVALSPVVLALAPGVENDWGE